MLATTDLRTHLQDIFGEPFAALPPIEPVSEMCMILVQSPQEQLARDSLRRRGVGVWWPNFQKVITKKDNQTGKRYQRVSRVGVLPGVILSPVSNEKINSQFFDALDRAPGVIGVQQKANGHWLLLSDLDIVLIHKIERGLDRPPAFKAVHNFKPDDKVFFVDDIYRKWQGGIVTKCARDGHISIDVNMMGCVRSVTVLPDQIEHA